MNNLSLDNTLTPNPFFSVSSLHHSRISKSLCLPRKVLVFADKNDNLNSITSGFLPKTQFSSKKVTVFAGKDDSSNSIASGDLSRTHFSSKKSKKAAVFASKDDNSSSITSGVLSRTVFFSRKTKKVTVFASKDDRSSNKLDQWDQMELKFGRLIGEDPKLTLAKIISRKTNPETSYLEIEESFDKKKGKTSGEIVEVPFDASKEKKSLNSSNGLNLVRPVPKKGVTFEVDEKPLKSEGYKQSQPISRPEVSRKSSVPNVILRKPSLYSEEDESSKFKIKPNLTLKMGKELKPEKFSDVVLLKKPEPVRISSNDSEKNGQSSDKSSDVTLLKRPEPMRINSDNSEKNGQSSDVLPVASDDTVDASLTEVYASTSESKNSLLLNKPEPGNLNLKIDPNQESSEDQHTSILDESTLNAANSSSELINMAENELCQMLQPNRSNPLEKQGSGTGFQQTDTQPAERSSDSNTPSKIGPMESLDSALLGKPRRLDQPKKATSSVSQEDIRPVKSEGYRNASEIENFLSKSPIKEHEDNDWVRAEELVKSGGREDVELVSCSTRGFVVSFGSLIGFLPYRNLAARWKFLAFESWLRQKGLDPSQYKQGLGIIGGYDGFGKAASPEAGVDLQIAKNADEEISPDMKLEDLLRIYDQEKLKFLSSFVGQRIRVSVVLADRNSRRLIFSIKAKEKEELVEKKRSLMAKLQVGDVVKCCIQKITYFGIFVEVEGVPALIHQTEVSWDATLDPASYFKIGQIVEAKVHQLDFSLERIFLSLKEITPDPMMEALEAVVGDHDNLNGELQEVELDTEWPDVESLIKELQQFEGISSVSKGRYFLSPGLAPTFQVYMASMFENQYKLLARSGNRVQEVVVETSLSKEEMKSAIQSCTNKVE
ncbi:sister chromatid cohesion protein PDS5 homolog C [Solanum dulcamara]|uniref:sister chromatid cohesion protein PDS5 homolog C n=1 Tax=Solanum dulcamara TaxID=45834 RepID=UPI002485C233|nr:sister chromatid cohesion protein PDS5 homolog C [Solanum dulcamara]